MLMKTTHRSLTGAGLLLALTPWMTVCVRADEAEDKAVKAIQEMGGRIYRDEKAKDKPIVFVSLNGTEVADPELKHLAKHLAGLKQLQTLGLRRTKVTDKGLEHLAGLKQLQTLGLVSTQVTDAGLKHLAGLRQLRKLDLTNTQVTDAGLKHLAGLKQLKMLDLRGTKVTGKGKADLKKALPKLQIK
jgi:Leucine-rich repeat (LRR) protein